MSRLSLILLCYLTLAGGVQLTAQEDLTDLRYYQERQALETKISTDFSALRTSVERRPFIYKIDTISLPIFDDFSTNRIKKYHAQKTDPNVAEEVRFGFTVNGQHPEVLQFMKSPTYDVTKSGTTITQTMTPELYITYYDDGKPIQYDTGWTNVTMTIDLNNSVITYDTIYRDVELINTFDTLYIVEDDISLWTIPDDEPGRGSAIVNYTFAMNPITRGVATFDGTDVQGIPYDLSSETSHGPADTLESKPIYIDSTMSNIFLSFFYQAGGYGNSPQEEDSLVLEFYSPADSSWNRAWSSVGGIIDNSVWSEQVVLKVEGAAYQRPGFKFRFRNYATLSANLDHWHIDYIRMDDDVDTNTIDTISDVAFASGLTSFTLPYSSVPYRHYLEEPALLQHDTTVCVINNLGPVAVNVLSIGFEIYDSSGTVFYNYFGNQPNHPPYSAIPYVFAPLGDISFPDEGGERAEFSVNSYFTISGGNDRLINDTAKTSQSFQTYYSYDDGSAEKAYSLTGAGVTLAYRFDTPVEDTLKAVLVNFPQAITPNAEDLPIEIMIWKDKDLDPIYISESSVYPKYTSDNSFHRFELDSVVIVEGEYFIGYRQINDDKIYIGFDMNNVRNSNIFYRITEQWFTSSFEGALMMRADFGDAEQVQGVSQSLEDFHDGFIYPNPTSDIFYVRTSDRIRVTLYDASGLIVKQQTIDSGQGISTRQLTSGVYFVETICEKSGELNRMKLIIAR